jgi:hypothetical protein
MRPTTVITGLLGFGLVGLTTVPPASGAPPENAVRALVGRWVEVQNTQNLAEYAKLYSEKFTGVRKSGDKEVRFDHKSWMADRARMFKKPFKVSIDSLDVKPGPNGFEVGFSQNWESSTYADTGWKTMRIVDEGGTLRIVEEAMKYSEKQIATPKTFVELLAKTDGVAPSWFDEVALTRSANGFAFSFVRELGEGGDERYSGSYRADGTLETVTQELSYWEHSMGPENRSFEGTLTRSFSADGKPQQVSGKIRISKLKNKKVISDRKITKVPSADTEYFSTKLPPLKVPPELLKPQQ